MSRTNANDYVFTDFDQASSRLFTLHIQVNMAVGQIHVLTALVRSTMSVPGRRLFETTNDRLVGPKKATRN